MTFLATTIIPSGIEALYLRGSELIVTAFNPEFMGVSGEISEVVKLGYQLGVEKLAPMENHMNQRIISHTNHLIVVNSDAEVIGIFKAPFESSSMTLVIKSLLSSQ